jgi:hypothetical protein
MVGFIQRKTNHMGERVRSIMEVNLFRHRRLLGIVTLPFFLSLAVMTITTCAYGQAATGRLSGTVSGPDGLIANATVVATDNQTKQAHTTATNAQGAFSFPQLDVGSYSVTFSATGFKTLNASDVRIDVGKEYVLTPTLQVGGIEESVNVFGGADIVNSTNAELSNTVTETQLLGLPINGRDPSSLIQLQPGVTQGGEVDGIRNSAQNITRDGLNVQDNFIREGDFNPDRPRIDDLSEFTIVTQNANPSLGIPSVAHHCQLTFSTTLTFPISGLCRRILQASRRSPLSPILAIPIRWPRQTRFNLSLLDSLVSHKTPST